MVRSQGKSQKVFDQCGLFCIPEERPITTEVATIPTKENALTVFSAAQGLDPYLAQIRAEIDGFTPDISTRKGRDAIASIAYKVARSKTALDNVGKELVAELKDIPKKIDAERKSKVLKAAKDAFIGMNISEELAKAIVLKIARGEVPAVTINF